MLLLVVLPILVLLLVAILPYYHVPTWQTWSNLTLDHFRYIWATVEAINRGPRAGNHLQNTAHFDDGIGGFPAVAPLEHCRGIGDTSRSMGMMVRRLRRASPFQGRRRGASTRRQ